jgi:DNA-binding NtrC family response regulator
MSKQTSPHNELVIVLIEDDFHHRKKLKKLLLESFPNCRVKTIAHGIEAMNYLLTPVNIYHLVILDGKLNTSPQTLITEVNGPDVATAMKERDIKVPVVIFTQDPKMLQCFDEIYGQRLPEIEKPCRKANVEAVLNPLIKTILHQSMELHSDSQSNNAENARQRGLSLP